MTPAPEPSLREKIGQMLLVGFRGATPAECDLVVRDIRAHHVGGVILFDQDVADPALGRRNIHSPAQVRELLRANGLAERLGGIARGEDVASFLEAEAEHPRGATSAASTI